MSASDLARALDSKYLQGHWPLNGNLDDYSGHGANTAIWGGAAVWAAGPHGKQVADLSSGYIRITAIPAWTIGTNAFSFAMWVLAADATATSRPCWCLDATDNDGFAITESGTPGSGTTTYYGSVFDAGVPKQSSAAKSCGVWKYLVLTWNGTATLYIDSEAQTGSASGSYNIALADYIFLGAYRVGSQRFTGKIHGVRLHVGACLTGSEVRALYLHELAGGI